MQQTLILESLHAAGAYITNSLFQLHTDCVTSHVHVFKF